ncbi:CD166 antigen-like [Sceloporus undulatus]|uniref:CD166 antigen-like n=1 Tax=Sceloporus undulatus TaxID=8520 RepID=UPI001C4DCC70|nr:CD166 antigen-like [Sceloporus undulatus]
MGTSSAAAAAASSSSASSASGRGKLRPPTLGLPLLGLFSALCFRPGLGLYTVNTVYGDTIILPCHLEVPDELMFGKWKYEIANKPSVFIAFRSATKKNIQYDDVPEYKDRLSLSENYTLSINNARIGDEKKFVCMLVTEDNVFEQATIVKVFKQPSRPEIISQAEYLETEQLKMLGQCIAKDGYPEGNLTWFKNEIVLQPVEGTVVIHEQTNIDQASGLYTVISSLEYKPTKDDTDAQFTCTVTYFAPTGQETIRSESAVFDIHYPTEKVKIQVLSQRNSIKEGDNITLKCSGNGNPPPQEFLFYIPGEPEPIRSSSLYALIDVRRNATGEYRCSLIDESLMDSTIITIHCKGVLSRSPMSVMSKDTGESNDSLIDNTRMRSSPSFSSLQYQDAGNYICETTLQEVEGLRKRQILTLIVQGKPQIKMSKKTSTDGSYKTIACHVEGFPKPAVQWSSSGGVINKTEETKYVNGKFVSKIKIAPEENVTLTCIAENQLERTVHSLNVSAISIPESDEPEEKSNDNRENVNDQAKLIVGIVVGLLLAALVAGVAYWIYVKKSKDVNGESEKEAAQNIQTLPRSASKHVDKDLGNIEENKKLEENNHKSEA